MRRDVDARLAAIAAELEPEDSRRRIAAAIRAHRQRAEEIEKVLQDRAELEERKKPEESGGG